MRPRELASLAILTALAVVVSMSIRGSAQQPSSAPRVSAQAADTAVARSAEPGVRSQQAAPRKKWTAPRMPWGEPDLQGVWSYANLTPLERPTGQAGRDVLNDEEVAELDK